MEHDTPFMTMSQTCLRQLWKCILLVSTCVAFTGAATAQSQDTVTLKYANGDRISGEFIGLTEGAIRLNTLMGVVIVPLAEVSCEGAACPSQDSPYSPIVLTALDGSFTVIGDLIEIVDNQYVVATELSELRVDIDIAQCSGIGCVTEAKQLTFGGDVSLTDGNLLIEGKLVDIEGAAYIVDVETMGTIRVNSDVFQCSGPGCP